MSELEKYNEIFKELFDDEIPEEGLEDFGYGDSGWDSVMNMDVLVTIEKEFEITMSSEEKMSFDSYESGKKILEQHGIHM